MLSSLSIRNKIRLEESRLQRPHSLISLISKTPMKKKTPCIGFKLHACLRSRDSHAVFQFHSTKDGPCVPKMIYIFSQYHLHVLKSPQKPQNAWTGQSKKSDITIFFCQIRFLINNHQWCDYYERLRQALEQSGAVCSENYSPFSSRKQP